MVSVEPDNFVTRCLSCKKFDPPLKTTKTARPTPVSDSSDSENELNTSMNKISLRGYKTEFLPDANIYPNSKPRGPVYVLKSGQMEF